MPDSTSFRDRPDPRREAVFGTRSTASNGSRPDEPPEPAAEPDLSSWAKFETWLKMRRGLLGLRTDEAHLRRIDAAATQAVAKAEEANHRAAAEPERQKVSILERTFRLAMELLKYCVLVLLTLVLAGIQIAGFIISPWFFSLNLLIAAVGFWVRQLTSREAQDAERDRGRDP
jgi:hypothetical protein